MSLSPTRGLHPRPQHVRLLKRRVTRAAAEPFWTLADIGLTSVPCDVVAHFGRIDRSIGEPPCARRCRRTNGTSLRKPS